VDKYQLENKKYVDEQLAKLPHQHRDAALHKYTKAIEDGYQSMITGGMAPQMAETRSVAAANTRLGDYVDARLKTLRGATQAPPEIHIQDVSNG
jgi:hypothetical protein